MSIQEEFARVGFTPEEKMDLTARLKRAAEEEETMTASTKRKIKKISGGMVFGIAAACLMSVGTLAAVLSPGLRNYFDAPTPGAQEALESSIYRLGRSETYNGWTVTLDECIGDDSTTWVWVDITAPEEITMSEEDGRWLQVPFRLTDPADEEFGYGTLESGILSKESGSNKLSCVFTLYPEESIRGKTLDVVIEPITDAWFAEGEDGEREYHDEGSELTQAIRDHEWTFENVVFDFPDQTVRMTPDVEIPYLEGTSTVSKLTISPLGMVVRVEGGSCGKLLELEDTAKNGYETTIETEDVTISFGLTSAGQDAMHQIREWMNELEVCVVMKDGSTQTAMQRSFDFYDGLGQGGEKVDLPFMERHMYFPSAQADGYQNVHQVLDLSQVDYVTVCGVEIPMPEEEPQEELTIWQQIFRHYWK